MQPDHLKFMGCGRSQVKEPIHVETNKPGPGKEPQSGAMTMCSKASSVKSWAYYEDQNPKHRNYMEDCGSHMDGVLGDPDFGVWGIYDGHLSHTLSEYLSRHLIKEFVADFQAAGKPNHLS